MLDIIMEEKEKTRCFISLDLPRGAIREIEKIQKQIKSKKLFDGKITEGENLHLTLKFLGELSSGEIEEIKKRLQEIKFEKFEAKLGKIGVFSKKFIRIIWIELLGKGVFELQKQIDEKLADLFDKESRFISHITIARVKRVYDKKGFLEYLESIRIPELGFNVDEFHLKKSELFETGPIYDDILEIKSCD